MSFGQKVKSTSHVRAKICRKIYLTHLLGVPYYHALLCAHLTPCQEGVIYRNTLTKITVNHNYQNHFGNMGGEQESDNISLIQPKLEFVEKTLASGIANALPTITLFLIGEQELFFEVKRGY